MRGLKFIYFINLFFLLTACGGGGGGGGGGGDEPRLTLSDTSIRFEGIDGGGEPAPQTVTGTVSGKLESDIYVVIGFTESDVITDVDVDVNNNAQTGTITIFPGAP